MGTHVRKAIPSPISILPHHQIFSQKFCLVGPVLLQLFHHSQRVPLLRPLISELFDFWSFSFLWFSDPRPVADHIGHYPGQLPSLLKTAFSAASAQPLTGHIQTPPPTQNSTVFSAGNLQDMTRTQRSLHRHKQIAAAFCSNKRYERYIICPSVLSCEIEKISFLDNIDIVGGPGHIYPLLQKKQ